MNVDHGVSEFTPHTMKSGYSTAFQGSFLVGLNICGAILCHFEAGIMIHSWAIEAYWLAIQIRDTDWDGMDGIWFDKNVFQRSLKSEN